MKRTAIASLVLLGTLTLAGCSAAGMSQSDSGASYPMEAEQSTDGGAMSIAENGYSEDSVKQEPQVVTTGFITVLSDDPIAAAAEAIRVVESVGGRIDSRSETAATESDKGYATLVLRIPAEAQTSTITKLRGLGDVQEVKITSDTVTAEVADLAGRISALQASVDRLTTLLETADDTDTLISIESSLSSRQGELESLQSQQRALADQVAMSTITLSLVSEPLPPKEDAPDTFLTGLAAGWESFVGFILGLSVVVGALLPWLVFLALLGGIALVLYRWRRSKKTPASTPDSDVPAA